MIDLWREWVPNGVNELSADIAVSMLHGTSGFAEHRPAELT
jgi:hypothetical protein